MSHGVLWVIPSHFKFKKRCWFAGGAQAGGRVWFADPGMAPEMIREHTVTFRSAVSMVHFGDRVEVKGRILGNNEKQDWSGEICGVRQVSPR